MPLIETKLYLTFRNSSQMFGHQNEEREVVQKVVSGAMRTQSTYHTSYGEMPTSVAATVYIRIDELYKGDYIVSISLEHSEIFGDGLLGLMIEWVL